ncbi:MAG: shikimate dehydrogenase [Akkermansia sp.]
MSKNYYSIDDFEKLEPAMRLAVIGNPIAHSKSPNMQQAALDAAGLPYRYVRLQSDTTDGKFADLVNRCKELGFIGMNVTVPFKGEAYGLAVQHDTLSEICGASNTLVQQADGWHAYNTDGPGFQRAIEHKCGQSLNSLRVIILGACGGAGRAIAAQCALAGCKDITLVNRPRPELEQLQTLLQTHAPSSTIRCLHFDSSELQQVAADAELIVNATVLGLHAGDPMPMPTDYLHPHHFVYDIVPHETAFCHAAESKQCLCATGEQMLLWQGAIAFEHWFHQSPDVAAMAQALS